ncbi:MAG: hypothetical protein Q8882_06665, partial [Bacillota bacterium]|nr:hypothetical protein [Bacillota bacterium]
ARFFVLRNKIFCLAKQDKNLQSKQDFLTCEAWLENLQSKQDSKNRQDKNPRYFGGTYGIT